MSYPILQFQQSVTACFQTNESYAPLSLANLFSTFHEVNATYLIDGLTLMNRPYIENSQRGITNGPYDIMAVQHAYACLYIYGSQKNIIKAYEEQHKMAQEFMRHFQMNGSSFELQLLYQICRDLRVLARRADDECVKNNKKAFAMDECARFLNKGFTACIQHKSSGPESKRWGVYYMIGLVFKSYFEINTLSLCKNILRAVGAMKDLMPLETYPKPHQVTFKYYTGVLAFLDDKFDKANEDLTYALNKCTPKAARNIELILTHLIPLRFLQGELPSPDFLKCFPKLEELYAPFVKALKNGNVKEYDIALVRGEIRLAEKGIYGLVERIREICLRGLFKKVWNLSEKQKIIEIYNFKKALEISGVKLENDEVECLIAGLIFKGYIKGYIAHSQQKIVLSDYLGGKPHPFPNVKSVTPFVQIPF